MSSSSPLSVFVGRTTSVLTTELPRKLLVLRQSRMAMVGATIIAVVLLMAVFAPVIAPHPPVDGQWQGSLDRSLQPPFWQDGGSLSYPLGTDEQGRDIFSRILYGIRLSIIQGIAPVLLSSVVGVSLGLVAGFFGGWIDETIGAIIDSILSIPLVILALAIVGIYGAGLVKLILVIAATQWVVYARTIRAQTFSIKNEEYIEAQHASGASSFWILRHGILPNASSSILVMATLNMAQIIIIAAGLTFLGLGVNPPKADLGLMMATGRQYLLSAWWYTTFPGLFLLVLVLGINLLGDGLRDILDPKYME